MKRSQLIFVCNLVKKHQRKLHQMYHRTRSPAVYMYLLIWGVTQQCVYETKIHDIDDL